MSGGDRWNEIARIIAGDLPVPPDLPNDLERASQVVRGAILQRACAPTVPDLRKRLERISKLADELAHLVDDANVILALDRGIAPGDEFVIQGEFGRLRSLAASADAAAREIGPARGERRQAAAEYRRSPTSSVRNGDHLRLGEVPRQGTVQA